MNKLFPIVLALLCFSFSEEYEDVIYLKDGSVIYGTIIEEKPFEYYKIQSERNIYICKFEDIELIKKQVIKEEVLDDISNKTWTLAFGLSTKSPGVVGVSKDFKFTNNSAIFLSIGFPSYSIGITSQSDYNKNGWIFGMSLGGIAVDPFATTSLAYQWKKANSNSFFTLGLAVGVRIFRGDNWVNERTENFNIAVFSYDWRF